MKIASNTPLSSLSQNTNSIKTDFREKISQEDVKDIKAQIEKNSQAIMFNSTAVQSTLSSDKDSFEQQYAEFQTFLKDIGYEGKPIAELTQDEATELVSADGFFGITQTSERIANFVLDGANGDEDLLRAGREGMIQGFKEAEAMWGGELPEISQKTMQKALEMVDMAMNDLGFPILDQEV